MSLPPRHILHMSLVRTLIRTRFTLTSRAAAARLIESERDQTLAICQELGEEKCRKSATVPAMLGVDEDMREWSVYQMLEHNNIVNQRLTGQMCFLAGTGVEPDPDFDVKHDVMPTADPGPEQIPQFESSIAEHLQFAAEIPKLRGTGESPHTIFGSFDAHKWHCMFGFHLQIHRRQAAVLARMLD